MITMPLPFLLAIILGAALLVGGAVGLWVQAWDQAAAHRRTWLDGTVKPVLAWWADWLGWAVHHVVAHPLVVLCPPLGRRLHDATAPEGDRS